MNYKRVKSDSYGNPRYVFHFLAFLTDEEKEGSRIHMQYMHAVAKAKKHVCRGARAYRGRDFGGGIVIQSYNVDETIARIQACGTRGA